MCPQLRRIPAPECRARIQILLDGIGECKQCRPFPDQALVYVASFRGVEHGGDSDEDASKSGRPRCVFGSRGAQCIEVQTCGLRAFHAVGERRPRGLRAEARQRRTRVDALRGRGRDLQRRGGGANGRARLRSPQHRGHRCCRPLEEGHPCCRPLVVRPNTRAHAVSSQHSLQDALPSLHMLPPHGHGFRKNLLQRWGAIADAA
mmetsp:Transcript_44528/g.125766  ORF Transcript_44528/g.125766 Transcript_44528/m.125766 type:complete len:204 (+) Transcript_44528:292-903(+)